jgi:hypothetical protein
MPAYCACDAQNGQDYCRRWRHLAHTGERLGPSQTPSITRASANIVQGKPIVWRRSGRHGRGRQKLGSRREAGRLRTNGFPRWIVWAILRVARAPAASKEDQGADPMILVISGWPAQFAFDCASTRAVDLIEQMVCDAATAVDLVDATPDVAVARVLPDVPTAEREVNARSIFGILLMPQAMPVQVRWLAQLLPSTFAIAGLVDVAQLGAGLSDIRAEFLGLWLLAALYACIAVIIEFVNRWRASSLACG